MSECKHAAPWAVQEAATRLQIWFSERRRARDESLRSKLKQQHNLSDSDHDKRKLQDLESKARHEPMFARDELLRSARWHFIEARRRYSSIIDEDGLDSWQRNLLYAQVQRWHADLLLSGSVKPEPGRPFSDIVKEQRGVSWEKWRSQLAEAIRNGQGGGA